MSENKANELAKKALVIKDKMKNNQPLALQEFQAVVGGFKSQIEQALPMHLKKNADKYARQSIQLFRDNPKLAQAAPITIISAMMKASSLGLDLNPQLGQCYIIPYDNSKKVGNEWVTVTEAQFQIGYRGAICLAQRSNRVKRIAADVVREGDFFEYSKGLYPKLEHKPAEGERGDILFVYALANFTNDGFAFEVWTKGQVIEHAKKFSKSYFKKDYKTKKLVENTNSPWHTNFEAMAKKTLIMQIWKYLPIETELLLAGAQDETTVRDISNIAAEKDTLDILPERSETRDVYDVEDESESEEADIPPVKEESKAAVSAEDSQLEGHRRILLDSLGVFGLGLTDEEGDAWAKKRYGKKIDALNMEELSSAVLEVRKELDKH